MTRRQNNAVVRIVRGGIIAALYVALTYLSSLLGLSGMNVIQLRLSEALCILPVFLPEAIPALTLGCLISNLLTGAHAMDIILGSIATLIGALGTYFIFKALKGRLPFLASLPPVIANALIVPFVLIFAYGLEGGYFFFMLTVGLGELISASVLGTLLYYALKKTVIFDI